MNRDLVFALVPVALAACSGAPAGTDLPSAPRVDLAAALLGVPDRGDDPAVVFVQAPGGAACTGVLVDADVVLTARRCVDVVSAPPRCPAGGAGASSPRDLDTVRVLVGESLASATERARGQGLLVPAEDDLCRADFALLFLDATIDDVAPVVVSPTGAAVGDHVRTVALRAGAKVVRDHVPVAASSDRELVLAEGPCMGPAGGAVLGETSGQLVGVVSRSEPGCGPGDVAVRPDAFFALVQAALARGHASHQAHQAHAKKGPVDLGAGCASAGQCAAGACVSFAGGQYCTRTCTPLDRCPAKMRCAMSQESTSVCVEE